MQEVETMTKERVIIIGSGIAGCTAAFRLMHDYDVTIITKGLKEESNSMLAQGGVAAAVSKNDTPKSILAIPSKPVVFIIKFSQ